MGECRARSGQNLAISPSPVELATRTVTATNEVLVAWVLAGMLALTATAVRHRQAPVTAARPVTVP